MTTIHQSRLDVHHPASGSAGRSLLRALLLPFEVLHTQHWSAPWVNTRP